MPPTDVRAKARRSGFEAENHIIIGVRDAILPEAEERALRLVSDADDSESEFLFVQSRDESSVSEPEDLPQTAPAASAPEQPRSESSRFADLFTRLRQMQKGA